MGVRLGVGVLVGVGVRVGVPVNPACSHFVATQVVQPKSAPAQSAFVVQVVPHTGGGLVGVGVLEGVGVLVGVGVLEGVGVRVGVGLKPPGTVKPVLQTYAEDGSAVALPQ